MSPAQCVRVIISMQYIVWQVSHQVRDWLFILGSINLWNSFLRVFGDHNFKKETAVHGYHMYTADPHARRGHISHSGSSNSQN